MYVSLIGESTLLDNHSVWVYGFDTLAPKSMDALIEMAKRVDVNIMVNISDFDLDTILIAALTTRAESAGIIISKGICT